MNNRFFQHMPGLNDQSNGEQANLDAILKSSTYRIAHEDPDLLNSNVMRGVRMLLEITKPDLDLEAAGIESTVIVFGGARIVDRETASKRLEEAERQLSENPGSSTLKRQVAHAEQRVVLSRFYDSAREFCPPGLPAWPGESQTKPWMRIACDRDWRWAGNHGSSQPWRL